MNVILQGFLLGLSISLPVGPTNIEVLRRGLKEGWKSASLFVLGNLVALVFYLLLIIFGLSFLTQSKFFNILISFFGIIVLFYLSYSAIKDFFSKKEFKFDTKVESKKNFLPGVVLTIANPVVLLFWTGILSSSFNNKQQSLFDGLLLSLGIILGDIIFFIFYIFLIHKGRKFLNKNTFRYFSLIAGLILIYFGINFGIKFISSFR